MASNNPGQGRGLEFVVALVVVVFLAFLFFGDRFGAVNNGSASNASTMAPATASSPSITWAPVTPPATQPGPAAPSS
jgi:hypothetical protein